jgi:hypothetical protein
VPFGGSGSRAHQRSANALICASPSRSQVACGPAGLPAVANPLDNAVNPIPAATAWRLAHSCPFNTPFDLQEYCDGL